MWTGHADGSGQYGVALAMSQATRSSLISWKPIFQILSAHFQHKLGKLSIVIAYVPTNISEEVTKDEFYHALQNNLASISLHDISVVLMGANSMLGPEARDPYIRGTAIIETTSNNNGK